MQLQPSFGKQENRLFRRRRNAERFPEDHNRSGRRRVRLPGITAESVWGMLAAPGKIRMFR